MTAPSYKVLGMGTYGAVFEPAFPNVNAAGNPVEFPGYVTKAFFEEEQYDKALANAPMLAKNVPALHIPYNAYTRKVRVSNLPKNLRAAANIRGSEAAPLFLMRMPHKGYSFRDVVTNPQYKAKFEAIPVEVKVREVYKLMNIVKALGDAGYVHGDIREPNILVNLDAGLMTIIDFDLLKPKAEFAPTFPVPYYHIPPEASLLLHAKNIVTGGSFWGDFIKYNVKEDHDVGGFLEDDIFAEPKYYYNGIGRDFHPKFKQEAIEFAEGFVDALRVASSASDLKIMREHAEGLMSKSVDSFSLGYCLRHLFSSVSAKGGEAEFKAFVVNDLCPKMMNGNAITRVGIEDAMREFREFVQATYRVDLVAPTEAAAAAVVEGEAARLGAMAGAVPVVAAASARSARSRKSTPTSVKQLAAAAAAVEALPTPVAPKGKTRAQKRRAQRKRAKSRKEGRAA